jgi:hypothetical protein
MTDVVGADGTGMTSKTFMVTIDVEKSVSWEEDGNLTCPPILLREGHHEIPGC